MIENYVADRISVQFARARQLRRHLRKCIRRIELDWRLDSSLQFFRAAKNTRAGFYTQFTADHGSSEAIGGTR